MVSNPERGEVHYNFDGKPYTFKFNNAGKRQAEILFDISQPRIYSMIAEAPIVDLGPVLTTWLLFAATRKHHARDFPGVNEIDEFLDLLDEEDIQARRELNYALLAAFGRTTLKEFRSRFEDSPEEAEASKDEDEEEEGKDEEPEETQKAPAATKRGKGSSKKQSDAA